MALQPLPFIFGNPEQDPWYRDWVVNFALTAPVSTAKPNNQYVWPLPVSAPPIIQGIIVGRTESLPVSIPFNQYAWPLPVPPTLAKIDFGSSFTTHFPAPAGVSLTTGINRDWPNPQPVYWYRDWSYNFAIRPPAVATIGKNQYSWPLPSPVQWYQSQTPTNAILPTPNKPNNQYDWPNPTLPFRPDFYYVPVNHITFFPSPVITTALNFHNMLSTMGIMGSFGGLP